MYAANKLAYFESLGWKPDMYYYDYGLVRIEYLKQFEGNYLPELKKPLRSSSKKEINRVLDSVMKGQGADDEILIECHMPALALWGELIAARSKGKNTIFLIEESLPRFSKAEVDFYEYKIGRKELLSSGEKRLKSILGRRYDAQKYGAYNFNLKPYCNNVVDYTPVKLPDEISDAEYSIISVGRLDKPYIKPMLDEILVFVKEYNRVHFNLIVVGDDHKFKMSNYIKGLFAEEHNISLFLLGYVFPVPYDWVKIADVSIASSNSILVTADEGIPTIGIDIGDNLPIGIYGQNTNNLWRRKDEPVRSISQWLDDILIKKMYTKNLQPNKRGKDLETHLKAHVDFLESSDQSKEYYDVENMFSIFDNVWFYLKKYLIKCYMAIDAFLKRKVTIL